MSTEELAGLIEQLGAEMRRLPERILVMLLRGKMTLAEAEYGTRRRPHYSRRDIDRCMHRRHGSIRRSLTRRKPELAQAVSMDELMAILRTMPEEILIAFGVGDLTLCEARYAHARAMAGDRLARFVRSVNYEQRIQWLRERSERLAQSRREFQLNERLAAAIDLVQAGVEEKIVDHLLEAGTSAEHMRVYGDGRLRANTAPELRAVKAYTPTSQSG